MLFPVKPVAPAPDGRKFLSQRLRRAEWKSVWRWKLCRFSTASSWSSGQERKHALPTPCNSRTDLARLREHLDRSGGIALVHVKHLTRVELREVDGFPRFARPVHQATAAPAGRASFAPMPHGPDAPAARQAHRFPNRDRATACLDASVF